LLKGGVSIETRERQGPTVLAIAAEYGRADTVRLLLEHGADIAAAGLDGDGAVIEAARMGNVAKLKLLLERGADVRLKNEALLEAAAFSIATIETPAAPPGAGENAEEHQGPEDVPFPSLDRVQTVTLLLEQGADIETRRDGDGSTPVRLAASHGNAALVKALLDKGARIEATNDEGSTALMGSACGCAQATMPDTIDSATLLLSRGANVHAKNKHGSTALMAAAGWGRTPWCSCCSTREPESTTGTAKGTRRCSSPRPVQWRQPKSSACCLREALTSTLVTIGVRPR
jgi:ankyrin repeat protein